MYFLAHLYTKDTNFIFGTPHTQYRYTQKNGHTHGHRCSTTFTFCTFCDMYVCQRYKFYIWHATDIHMHRYTNTCTHICRDNSTYRYRHMHTDINKHTCRHTDTHAFFYIHKHTYIFVRSILPAHFIFSCHLPNELRSPWTYFLCVITLI